MTADPAIKHIILLMMENHSFDQMLGSLHDEYSGLDGVDLDVPTPRYNLDLQGNKVLQIPTDEQQVPLDPKHETRYVLDGSPQVARFDLRGLNNHLGIVANACKWSVN